MADMEILNQMIKNSARSIPHNDMYGNLCVELREPRTDDSTVTIRHLPADAIVIKVDEFRSPDSVFKGEKGECKRADYVIISAEKKCILYIEIKRTMDNWRQIVNQLKGAQCFVSYCQEIGKAFWNSETFLVDYKKRFISIGHNNINVCKKKTRINTNSGRHDTPENAMRIDWPNYLKFNHLAGLGR